MNLPYSEDIEIQYLSRLFDNTSECYKFFWFQAIVTKILSGKDTFTFEELVNDMIVDAWYMVTEYHLNLGPKDNLERLVNYIKDISNLKPSEKKGNVLAYINECDDREVMGKKRELIKNVPYRLQALFMPEVRSGELEGSKKNIISKINQQQRLMYYFGAYSGLNTTIQVQDKWIQYIHRNQEIIKGWLQYKMIIYLQKRNPSVPGIAEKLYPPTERKMEKVKKYWKTILTLHPIEEIYSQRILTEDDISIDHFVPWSYVAHDELWNLHPTTKSINSKKSNNLPDWDIYFSLLCKQEYLSYSMIWKYEQVHKEFDKCAKEHINNDQIRHRLYREGLQFVEFQGILNEIIAPVYESAKNSGFGNWVLTDER